jgi:hypothetical protein
MHAAAEAAMTHSKAATPAGERGRRKGDRRAEHGGR